ncbi:MAG: RtcB family protein [Anaerolineae bacterium]
MKPVTRSDLRKAGDFLYEIPESFRADMRVPAHFYADDDILTKALEDRSLEQLVNTATLPGIVGQAMAMPDIHQGYGFPIGGVVATRLPNGVISPGGVGYDINCLAGDSRVLHALGYTQPIAQMVTGWVGARLLCQDFGAQREAATEIIHYLRRPAGSVYRLRTESGQEITATGDHPFWTPDGMVPLARLAPGDRVAVWGFDGVPYEAPADDIILTQADVEAILAKHGKGQTVNGLAQTLAHLGRAGLLPLRYSSPQLPYLLRLMGMAWGNGALYFEPRGKGVLACYGEIGDLEALREDVKVLGFRPSRIYARPRRHALNTGSRFYEFERVETWFEVRATGLAAILAALGLPLGSKVRVDWRLPGWIKAAPLWQKRLFLAALFGAEMNAPDTIPGHGYDFQPPTLSLNKGEDWVASGRDWLADIVDLLAEFNVRTLPIEQRVAQTNADGTRLIRLQLTVASDPENLDRLWSQIGFECHRKKRALASIAVTYLRLKQQVAHERDTMTAEAAATQDAGRAVAQIEAALSGPLANVRFIRRSLWEGRAAGDPVGRSFMPFAQFVEEATAGLGQSGMAWDRISEIEHLPDYAGDVYDFTVAHHDHNFIANGFVVSNCGVRLLGAHLDAEEIKPHIQALADALYRHVPSGVGVKGQLHVNKAELDRILAEGSLWALREGYATRADVDHTEQSGRVEGADPAKVSNEAKKRGLEQVGTLGSGNHFAEIDVVSEIFDAEAAAAFGLRKGQAVVQIHCGSRGLGHQVATDYIQIFQAASKRFGFDLPDKQLVCAPLDSREGQDYLAAMNCAANYAWANRQVLTYRVREAFEEVLAGKVRDWSLFLVYDVAHNMAKIETHAVGGREMKVCVHRKGATRAFGPGHPEVPADYRTVGQPVLVPGSMGTASYVLAGTAGSMTQTFGSCCHGAGRVLSRAEAKRQVRGEKLRGELEHEGIVIRAGSLGGLAEEAPQAYKDVDRVVAVVEAAGLARIVARLEPLAVVKG